MPLIGIALIAAGYALTYYGVNVLVWAHKGDKLYLDPAPLKYLLGFPIPPSGPPPNTPLFTPLFNLENADQHHRPYPLGAGPAGGPAGGSQGSSTTGQGSVTNL